MLQQIFGEYLVGVLKLKSMVFKIANFVLFFFEKYTDFHQSLTFHINDYLWYVNTELFFLLMI